MARSTFKVLFYVNGSKEKNGIVPIMGRVTINGTVAQFSCKQTIPKTLWDAKGNRAKGKSAEARDINLALDNIKAQIIKHYQRISDREAYVTAEMVRNAYQGIGSEYETLLGAFDKDNTTFQKRVGTDRVKGTYLARVRARNHVAAFIKANYKRSDLSMLELTPDFIKEFAVFLSTDRGLQNGSIWTNCMWLKGVVMRAHFNGLIPRNPFAQFHIRSASFSFGECQSDNRTYRNLQVGELSSPALIAYLQERGINIGLAKRECKELHFIHNDKLYFAIGFPNMAGGFEVRNRYYKGCLAPKDITHIRQQGEPRNVCYLFEGFMDYLSFLTIRTDDHPDHPRLTEQDYMVLNSVSNIGKAEQLLRQYTRIGSFLDNDHAGRNAYDNLKRILGDRLQDMSIHYAGYNDLNEYLCNRQSAKQTEPTKQVQSARRMIQPPKKRGLKM